MDDHSSEETLTIRQQSLMAQDNVSVRPFSSAQDYELMIDYFLSAEDSLLRAMGVKRSNLPERDTWLEHLMPDLARSDEQKQTFFLAWQLDGAPVGHSNINSIRFGHDASMHLHLWKADLRRRGLGTEFVRKSVQVYFDRFHLEKLVCEPWSQNEGPNRALQKVGFTFVRTYRTTPSPINSELDANRYELFAGDWLASKR